MQRRGPLIRVLREVSPRPFEVAEQPRRQPVTHREFDVARLREAVGGDLALTPFADALRETFRAEQEALGR
jgi:hypothetical protein